MNRRDFLKATGISAASAAISRPLLAEKERKNEMLDQADARIEKNRKGNVELKLTGPDGKPLQSGHTVKIEQKRHKFLFGCNIFKLNRCRTPEDNAAYEKHFAELLNFATLPFYWWNYERRQGQPDDERTDEIVRWCKAHNVTTKGHPLAWNYVDPRWLPKEPEEAMQLQLKRIDRCVQRFKNDINIWDVVNEATHYDRQQVEKQAPILTEAIRKMGVGAYVREAFKAARQANPKATLLINDYRTDPDYAEKVISELINENNQPMYDVIGIQSHMHGGCWPVQKTWEVCERFAKFGKPLHFTETTVVSGKQGWELNKERKDPNFRWISTPEEEKRQAKQVAEFYRILFSHPAVEAITWWDFTDQNAWQQAPAGLIREDMSPKPAYEELERLIKGKWWTKTEATTDTGGTAKFRGFLGEYEVNAQVGGKNLTGTFHLDKTAREIDAQLKA
ncbi:MAG: endo-1,4-beta-xylanase [Sedimentisphaerales bacterium]|nr:endo-1,4-beta-xylanase [Sedimentisphaerales bacterium]